MTTAYIRCFLKRRKELQKRNWKPKKHPRSDLLFVFDNETTIAANQNLKVGGFIVIEKGVLIDSGFYNQGKYCSEKELQILKHYCHENNIPLLKKEDFVKNKFLEYIFNQKALCIGFNLPFDLPLLGIDCSFTKGKRFYNGFSIKLMEQDVYPRIKIKARGKKYALIEFGSTPLNKKNPYKGRFLDLHTLSLALSGEKSINLKNAGKRFKAKVVKEDADEHGTITPEYLDYLARDVLATHSLYEALIRELAQYGINTHPENIFSQASIGKALLDKMGVPQRDQIRSEYANKKHGEVMGTYYGGISQVACRHQPEDCVVVDVTSMYPTVNILTDMQDFLIAEKIHVVEATKEIQDFLDNTTVEDLQNPETWKHLPGFAFLKPNKDKLPFRGNFDPDSPALNITIAELTSDIEIPYTIADLIGSKIRTGKAPQITKGYRFKAIGRQKNLKPIELLGLKIDPRIHNFFKTLVNERQRIKRQLKKLDKNSAEYQQLKSKEQVIKLIINSTGYGIYVELHIEPSEEQLIVYGLSKFESEGQFEKAGPYFNPFMGVTITGAARLFLTLIEHITKQYGGECLFCDTDSMAIPQHCLKPVQKFFRPLNPYDPDIELVKDETAEYGTVKFLGISSKRYCLYREFNGKIEILKHSLHGLGLLQNPFNDKKDWQEHLWELIIKRLTGRITDEDLEEEYGNIRVATQLTISNQEQWKQVRHLNEETDYEGKIKPGGFVTRGYATTTEDGIPIKPIAPFNKDTQAAARGPFTNAYTGETHQGIHYWKRLLDLLEEYMHHPENKLDGDKGMLTTKSLHITHIKQIGKESKTYPTEGEDYEPPSVFHNKKEDYELILNMRRPDALERGITPGALSKIQKRIREGKKLNPKSSAVRKLLQ